MTNDKHVWWIYLGKLNFASGQLTEQGRLKIDAFNIGLIIVYRYFLKIKSVNVVVGVTIAYILVGLAIHVG